MSWYESDDAALNFIEEGFDRYLKEIRTGSVRDLNDIQKELNRRWRKVRLAIKEKAGREDEEEDDRKWSQNYFTEIKQAMGIQFAPGLSMCTKIGDARGLEMDLNR